MKAPTGKLAFAYQTIAKLEADRDRLRMEVEELRNYAPDQDRDRRNEVAMALGLMNNGDFSWAFLLQKIRECAKASGHEYALPFRLQR